MAFTTRCSSLNFHPHGKIIFAATNDDYTDDDSQDIYGSGGKQLAVRAIAPFINGSYDK